MVVNADRMLRILQKRQRIAKPLLIRTVQSNKKIVRCICMKLM